MLKEIVWFTIGFVVGKLTEDTETVKKIEEGARKCVKTVKEQFGGKDERREILFRKF